MRIRRYNDDSGELNHYGFYAVNYGMGDPIELVSPEEFECRKQSVIENEGEEALNTCGWYINGEVRFMKFWEQSIMTHFIRRWEAVCELVSPGYTV